MDLCASFVELLLKTINYLGETNEHNHPSDPADCQVVKIVCEMRKRAREGVTPVPQIFDEEKIEILQNENVKPEECSSRLKQF